MNITLELNTKQATQLARMLHVADFIMANEEEDYAEDLISILNEKLFKAGMTDLVEYDEELGDYFLTEENEESTVQTIVDYEEECFWSALVERLAERDLDAKGIDLTKITPETRLKKLEEASEIYYDEFEKNDLTRLVIKK